MPDAFDSNNLYIEVVVCRFEKWQCFVYNKGMRPKLSFKMWVSVFPCKLHVTQNYSGRPTGRQEKSLVWCNNPLEHPESLTMNSPGNSLLFSQMSSFWHFLWLSLQGWPGFMCFLNSLSLMAKKEEGHLFCLWQLATLYFEENKC